MKKRIITSILMVFMVVSAVGPAFAADTVTAKPTASTILIQGYSVEFNAYNINGNNYMKLRDLAWAVSGTEKQFDVDWDGANNAILLESGVPYTLVDGEMAVKGEGDKIARPTSSSIFLDGNKVTFTAYNIEGNNYFKLRDIGEAFDFGVYWFGTLSTILIDVSQGIEINLNNQGITSELLAQMIEKREIPTGVTHLSLSDNSITDISVLSRLTDLTMLDLWSNQVSDISPLSSLTGLTELELWGNQVNDIAPIGKLTELVRLSLEDVYGADLSLLSNCENLLFLGLGSGQISDFSPLSTLTKLKHLHLWGVAQLSDCSILGKLTNLESLTVNAASITDFAALGYLTNLTYLDLQLLNISDVSLLPLDRLTKLTELFLWSNQITDISPLKRLANLTTLGLTNNPLNENQLSELSEALPECNIIF